MAVIDNPILNSAFAVPARHWLLDENGVPTGIAADGRRRSEFVVPVPPARHRVKAQGDLRLEDEYGERKPNDYINEIRTKVGAWRALGDAGLRNTVTHVMNRLLQHWRAPDHGQRLFFCQIGAIENLMAGGRKIIKTQLLELRCGVEIAVPGTAQCRAAVAPPGCLGRRQRRILPSCSATASSLWASLLAGRLAWVITMLTQRSGVLPVKELSLRTRMSL